MRRTTKGFTLVELLVVVAIIALLISILVPSLTRARAMAHRVSCMANVKGVGQAIELYKSSYNGHYPMITDTKKMYWSVTMLPGGSNDVYDLVVGDHDRLNVNENLCLLVKEQTISWEMFRCPAVSGEVMNRTGDNKKYGFKASDGVKYYDYAYHYGYKYNWYNLQAAPFSDRLASEFVIYADQPGTDLNDFTTGNKGLGFNHKDDGVVVLCAGGNVRFSSGTFLTGWNGNNIYTRDLDEDSSTPNGGVGFGTLVNEHDSMLLPAY